MRIKFHWDRWWLLLAPIVVTALDAGLTLDGQPPSGINEVNPVGYLFLSWGKGAFVAGIVLWIVAYSFFAVILSKYLALVLVTLVTLGHTWGASTWLPLWADIVLWILSLLVLAGIWIWGRTRVT
jgi:hypothetical protein